MTSNEKNDKRQRVTGVGGVFFKCADPEGTTAWYEQHLGIQTRHYEGEGSAKTFEWREDRDPKRKAHTVWAPFPSDTEYFSPGGAEYMINYRVDDLDAMLEQLRSDGVTVVDGPSPWFNGRFAWILDPDGRKVELWEPRPGY